MGALMLEKPGEIFVLRIWLRLDPPQMQSKIVKNTLNFDIFEIIFHLDNFEVVFFETTPLEDDLTEDQLHQGLVWLGVFIGFTVFL